MTSPGDGRPPDPGPAHPGESPSGEGEARGARRSTAPGAPPHHLVGKAHQRGRTPRDGPARSSARRGPCAQHDRPEDKESALERRRRRPDHGSSWCRPRTPQQERPPRGQGCTRPQGRSGHGGHERPGERDQPGTTPRGAHQQRQLPTRKSRQGEEGPPGDRKQDRSVCHVGAWRRHPGSRWATPPGGGWEAASVGNGDRIPACARGRATPERQDEGRHGSAGTHLGSAR